jgi:integrase/recombinase XerD
MTDLRAAVIDYLAFRRALGFRLDRSGQPLNSFVDFLEARHATRITTDLAFEWATLPAGANPWWWRNRLSIIRGFARYAHGIDPAHEVPPAGLITAPAPRATPYMYSESDITELMAAATCLKPELRADTYTTLIGMLAVTGMRVSEALNLDDSDVDLSKGSLIIHATKFDKTRVLPLHSSAVETLDRYRTHRCRWQPAPSAPAFFVSIAGTRLHYPNVLGVFHQLIDNVGLSERRRGHRPRMHDFRHRFAVQSIIDAYTDGLDVGHRLAALSTYLGHARPADTYWYLSATPELLGRAIELLDNAQEVRP